MPPPLETQQVLTFIEADPRLRHLFQQFAAPSPTDRAHDLAHCLRVATWALRIAESDVDRSELIASALLHDIVSVHKSDPMRSKASEMAAEAARPLLVGCGFPGDATERIVDAIREHSFSRGEVPSSSLGRALQDADRLDALGAIGIFRLISVAESMGSEYYDANDPWSAHRDLNDQKYALDHFFSKLLKLADTMQTEGGRTEAHKRTLFLRIFLRQFGDEIGAPVDSRPFLLPCRDS